MNHPPALTPRRRLRAQAYRRLTAVLLLAAIGILVIGASNFYSVRERELAQRREQLREHFSDAVPRLETAWHTGAVRMRSRIEFLRTLSPDRSLSLDRLARFLDSQDPLSEFSDLVLFDENNRPLLLHGQQAGDLADRTVESTRWVYSPSQRRFYRVFQLPLRVGMGGEGRLVFYKSVGAAQLHGLQIPQTQLRLLYNGREVAQAGDRMQQNEALVARFPLSRDEAGDGPVLEVARDSGNLIPFWQFALRPLSAVALIGLLIVLVLGRWLVATARRIEHLDRSARLYGEGVGREAFLAELAAARTRGDEIGATAGALENLVTVIEARDEEQKSYLETLSLLDEAVIELDGRCVITRASPGWHTLTRHGEGVGRPLYDFIHPADVAALRVQCAALGEDGKNQASLRLRLLPRVSPEARDTWVECRLILKQGNGEAGLRGVLRDITQHYLHEQQITEMALHDALTGLPNRVLLEDRIKIALRLALRHGHKVGVCFIDLDHFKLVNDTLGHKAGDRLLIAFAERIKQHLRAGDTLARWGGDEFVLLLPDMEGLGDIRLVTEKIASSLQIPLELDGAETRVTFSMGVAVHPDDGDGVETLFSQADRAMFHAKGNGRNQVCFFSDMQSPDAGKKALYIQSRLALAIHEGRIETWFQPIVEARSGRCVSVEVLARWRDAEYGDISPATFIPMAENLGLIHELGLAILDSSLAAARRWRERGFSPHLAVNVSKRQLFIRSLPEQLLDAVVRHGLQPGDLILEITESAALSEIEHGAARVRELRQAGFGISIDDFGTGYSALSQLHEMQADELKIDISFVRRLADPKGRNMIQAIVHLAGLFGLHTVAEGVEDGATAAELTRMGVDTLQGYWFSKPLPEADFLAWLEGSTLSSAPAETQPAA